MLTPLVFNTCHHLLELGRWYVVQRRVQVLVIVKLVDEVADA